MGLCTEFGTTITDSCGHAMVADGSSCFCDVCAVRCKGRFAGCDEVWARGSQSVEITAQAPLAANGNGAARNGKKTTNGSGRSTRTTARGRPKSAPTRRRRAPKSPADTLVVEPADVLSPTTHPDDTLAIDWGGSAAAAHTAPSARAPVASTVRRPAAPPAHRRHRIVIVAAVVALALVLGGAGAYLVGSTGDAAAPPRVQVAPAPARLVFDPFVVADGVSGHRRWVLDGVRGDEFIGTLTFTNTSEVPVSATYDEVIPKSLASHVSEIRFRPRPVIVDPDPVVRFTVALDPGESTTATYEIRVDADGNDRDRLEAWAQDAETELAKRVEAAAEALANASAAEAQAAAQAALDAAEAAQSQSRPNRTPGGGGGGDPGVCALCPPDTGTLPPETTTTTTPETPDPT